jgi:uroporphyrin-III C-methyltransferase
MRRVAGHRAARPVVHLVGAGPGDPRLLTRRAARLLAAADVVVLDRRSLQDIASLAPATAERCFVGRTPAGPGWGTERIADLLAERAATGRTVVRLKSGDPFVCSRGGEERLALIERGVTCDVVPGVTAATAAPLAAGVLRGRTVTILAGNDDPVYPPLDLRTLADPASCLVVLTGRSRQGTIATTLLAAGLDPATPVAVVHAATRPGQRVVRCALADLGATHLPAPATVVIGPVQEQDDRAHP